MTPIASRTVTSRGWVKGQPIRFIKGHSGHKYADGETAIQTRWIVEDRGHDTPCWVWQLATKNGGYGVLMADGRTQVAHRYYYEQIHGKLPRRAQLDHLCRVRLCVNPDHLEPVTNAENSRRGVNSKLTLGDVEQIRAWLAKGWSCTMLAASYGVTQQQISNIKLGKSWA